MAAGGPVPPTSPTLAKGGARAIAEAARRAVSGATRVTWVIGAATGEGTFPAAAPLAPIVPLEPVKALRARRGGPVCRRGS